MRDVAARKQVSGQHERSVSDVRENAKYSMPNDM